MSNWLVGKFLKILLLPIQLSIIFFVNTYSETMYNISEDKKNERDNTDTDKPIQEVNRRPEDAHENQKRTWVHNCRTTYAFSIQSAIEGNGTRGLKFEVMKWQT